MRDKKKVVRFLGCRSHTMIGTSQIAIIHSSIRIMALTLFDAAWLAQADMPIFFDCDSKRAYSLMVTRASVVHEVLDSTPRGSEYSGI